VRCPAPDSQRNLFNAVRRQAISGDENHHET
jgi:hypothetical protein